MIKSITIIIVVCIIALVAIPNEPTKPSYTYMNQLVNKVANTGTPALCKRGATLILIGKNTEAINYDIVHGKCMRKLVHAVITR